MNLDKMSYTEFYLERTSWSAKQKAPICFTNKEIQQAVDHTDSEHFGYDEFSDQDKIAMEILVWAAQEWMK